MSPTVEARFGQLAQRRIEEGMPVPRFYTHETEAYKRWQSFPSFFPWNPEFRLKVRVHPHTGEVGIKSYRPKRRDAPATDIIFDLKQKPGASVTRRAKDGGVVPVWSAFDSVETAIRATSHIAEKYDPAGGEQIGKIKNTREKIETLLARFRTQRFTLEDLQAIARETARFLADHGFVTAVKPVKQNIFEQSVQAAGPDSLGRVNSLISRTRLGSAWLKVVGEIIAADKAFEKYSRLFLLLNEERDHQRFYIEQGLSHMEELINEEVPSHRFENRLIMFFRDKYAAIYLNRERITAAPYRAPVAFALAFLFGFQNVDDRYVLARMLPKNLFQDLVSNRFTPVDEILNNAEIDRIVAQHIAQARLESAYGLLQSFLITGEQNLAKGNSV